MSLVPAVSPVLAVPCVSLADSEGSLPPCHPAADLQPQEPSERWLSPLPAFNTQLPHLGEKVPVGVVMIKGVIQGASDIHTQLPYNS